jgi:cytochrome c-type biogenesis protein CcmH/NrfF
MKRFLTISAAVWLALGLSGQTVSTGDKMHLQLRAVGEKLKCQCGCAYTVGSCNMLNCHFREEVNAIIRPMLQSGADEPTILGRLQEKYGTIILAAPPAEGFKLLGYVMPFIAMVLGLFAIWYFLKRWKRPAPPLAAVGPVLDKYQKQIEKELADLE